MKKKILIAVSKYVFKHLFKLVLEEEILRPDKNGNIWYRGRYLTKEERQDLEEQAKLILKQPLWEMLTKEMEYLANKRMFHESKDEIDMLGGKMMLYLIDVLRKKLYNIRGFK